jgi:hypothetical protein
MKFHVCLIRLVSNSIDVNIEQRKRKRCFTTKTAKATKEGKEEKLTSPPPPLHCVARGERKGQKHNAKTQGRKDMKKRQSRYRKKSTPLRRDFGGWIGSKKVILKIGTFVEQMFLVN